MQVQDCYGRSGAQLLSAPLKSQELELACPQRMSLYVHIHDPYKDEFEHVHQFADLHKASRTAQLEDSFTIYSKADYPPVGLASHDADNCSPTECSPDGHGVDEASTTEVLVSNSPQYISCF